MTTDLWDWADVAAVGVYARLNRHSIVQGIEYLHDRYYGIAYWLGVTAAAIRYGYEQAQMDAARSEQPVAASASVDCHQCGGAGGYGPEPCSKCDATGKMVAPEFPRVWVDLWPTPHDPAGVIAVSVSQRKTAETQQEYIPISELERLREAARKVVRCRGQGNEESSIRELKKALGE